MRIRNGIMLIFWIFLAVILALVVAGVTIAFLFGRNYLVNGTNYGYGMMGFGTGMWALGGFFMLIPVILFFLFIYWIFGIATDHGLHNWHDEPMHLGNSALETLDIRYAKGEISKDQYNTMKADILKK